MSRDPRIDETLDALVEEAYGIALKRGLAISKPDGWRRWKRKTYEETARREGAGYLRHHYQRLGLGSRAPVIVPCANCGESVIGNPVRKSEDDPTPYCSDKCAGIQTMTLREFLDTLDPDKRREFESIFKRRREGAA